MTMVALPLDPFNPYHRHHYGVHHFPQQHMMNYSPPLTLPFGNNGLVSSSIVSPPASPSPPPSASTSNASVNQYDPSSYVALDCEFVGVGHQGLTSALARVSLVGFDGNVLLDTFCAPAEQVIDYRSWVSGVREPDLLGAPSFQVVQNRVQEMLKGKVLVGHAVYNDLEVLGILHPAPCTRDTASYGPLQQLACTSRPSLRALAKLVLSVDVQSGEHSSIEDARVTMAIFRSHQEAWEASLPFPAPTLPNDRSFTSNRVPMQNQGRPVPVVRFPSAGTSSPIDHFQQQQQHPQSHRMYTYPMQGSPPPPPMKMNPLMMDPRFSAASLALPPPSPAQSPVNHVRAVSMQQSPGLYGSQNTPHQMHGSGGQSPTSPFNMRQQDNNGFTRDRYSPRRVSSSPAVAPIINNRSPSPSLSFESNAASSSSEESRQPTSFSNGQRHVVGMPEAKWDMTGRKVKRRGGKRTKKESFM